ncbi:MAG: hypothetical protein FWC97_00020 [Treponema sp.]|nr:hypothetical protein [Treponema sp.]
MRIFFAISLIFVNISFVFGLDLPVARISDDSILRHRLRESWFIDSPQRVLNQHARIELLQTGERVEVRAVKDREEVHIILARERMSGRVATASAPAVERRQTGQFPHWAQGSWMLTRNITTGEGTLIRIFLRSDQFTFIQLRPSNNETSLMDVIVYGGYVSRSLPIPVPFERLYTKPLNDILRLVEGRFPIRYFEPDPALYRDTRTFVANVRQHLGSLKFADDGAIDENGNFVFIASLQEQNPQTAGLNCSGFVKWLIDGILRPVTGERLTIPPLREPFGERGSLFTANWEERRDVFFGLDWIRNLAAEANRTLRSPEFSALEEFEVRTGNFSSIMLSQRGNLTRISAPGFLSEAGFAVEVLHPLLYTLAIDEPFSFFLAAVNREIATPNHISIRGTPRLRQYFHVAALVPFFDEFGIFRIAVFESAEETSFDRFRRTHSGRHVNLVKIPISPRFEPF